MATTARPQDLFANIAAQRAETRKAALTEHLPPTEDARTGAVLRLALASPAGKVLHDTSTALELFPPILDAATPRAVIIGTPKGKAARLARELGLRTAAWGDLFLVDDFARFTKRRRLK